MPSTRATTGTLQWASDIFPDEGSARGVAVDAGCNAFVAGGTGNVLGTAIAFLAKFPPR